ncbi:MAG: hypothetical protein GY749_27355 [Desulfobacteraceae bacterium]|nr:hypothetical protein [Desulfobacteraceae bacterium]
MRLKSLDSSISAIAANIIGEIIPQKEFRVHSELTGNACNARASIEASVVANHLNADKKFMKTNAGRLRITIDDEGNISKLG